MKIKKGIKPSAIFTLRVSEKANPTRWSYDLISTSFGKLIVAGEVPVISYVAFYETEKQALELFGKRNKGIAVEKKKGSFEVLTQLLTGQNIAQKIAISITGTSFQKKVWEALMDIPLGSFCSYGEIAKSIGHPKAYRAVGTAVGRNPVAYFIPCHRVLATGGGIGGYYWGTEVKERIIEWEKVVISN